MKTYRERKRMLLADLTREQRQRTERRTAEYLLKVDPGGRDDEGVVLSNLETCRNEVLAEDGAKSDDRDARADLPVVARLHQLAQEAELFCSPNGIAHASVIVNGGRETWRVRSRGFGAWLAGQYDERYSTIPPRRAVEEAADGLLGRAEIQGRTIDVFVRVAHRDGTIYLDLADAERHVVEVTADGWRVVTDVPVCFVRPKSMRSLPVPERGGSLDGFLRLLNLRDVGDMVLTKAWLVATLQPHGSFPVLVIGGEQGSAKTVTGGLAKRLIDPSGAPLRSPPANVKELMIAGTNSHVLAYDNLDHVPPWLSNALCRLASGGGLMDRELYTDAEESLLEAKRPVILTGIEELATRSDFLDRAVLLDLPAIPARRRRTEEEVFRNFEVIHAGALGALLDAASVGLRNLDQVRPDRLPRMADFARWVVACAPGLEVPADTFLAAYEANRRGANSVALESSPAMMGLLRLVDGGPFEGTATDLLGRLKAQESVAANDRDWPKSGRGMRGLLMRFAPNLRRASVEVTIPKREAGSRLIRLSRGPDDGRDDHDGSTEVSSGRVREADGRDDHDGSVGVPRRGGAA